MTKSEAVTFTIIENSSMFLEQGLLDPILCKAFLDWYLKTTGSIIYLGQILSLTFVALPTTQIILEFCTFNPNIYQNLREPAKIWTCKYCK